LYASSAARTISTFSRDSGYGHRSLRTSPTLSLDIAAKEYPAHRAGGLVVFCFRLDTSTSPMAPGTALDDARASEMPTRTRPRGKTKRQRSLVRA
jgi:hypothetical protein